MTVPSRSSLFAALGVVAALVASPALADACKLERVAQIPAHLDTGDRLLVDATVTGLAGQLVLAPDLGYTALSTGTVQAAGLEQLRMDRDSLFYAGQRLTNSTRLPWLRFGGMERRDHYIAVLPAGVMAEAGAPSGILGRDFLHGRDLEIDLAGGVVNLFAPNECAGRPVYWTGEWFELPLLPNPDHRLEATVTVDGKPLRAVLDPSIGRSVLAPGAASVTGAAPARLANLGFGGITFHNVAVDLGSTAPADAAPGAAHADQTQLRIGMHELKRLRLFVDYEAGRIDFTPATTQAASR